jgi:hypothetical protein
MVAPGPGDRRLDVGAGVGLRVVEGLLRFVGPGLALVLG